MLFLFLNIHSLFRIELKKKARPTTAEQYIPSWMKNCVWQRFYFLTKQPVQYTHTVPGLKSPEGISMIDAFLSTDCFTFFRLTNSCETWITPGNETTENQSGTNLTSQLWCTWRLLLTSDWGLTFSQLNGQPALTSVFWFAPFFFFFFLCLCSIRQLCSILNLLLCAQHPIFIWSLKADSMPNS